MDLPSNIDLEIEALNAQIELSPEDHTLYMRRGQLYHKMGNFSEAFNDFITVTQLDKYHTEAQSYVDMLREIFAFRHLDNYNP